MQTTLRNIAQVSILLPHLVGTHSTHREIFSGDGSTGRCKTTNAHMYGDLCAKLAGFTPISVDIVCEYSESGLLNYYSLVVLHWQE